MENTIVTELRNRTEISKSHLCLVCKGTVAEVDRVTENGFLFVWYRCQDRSCDGQWLEKRRSQ